MNPQNCTLPYFKIEWIDTVEVKSLEKARRLKAEKIKASSTNATQGETLCFSPCNSKLFYFKRKERRKGDKLQITFPNKQVNQHSVVYAERFTKEQYFLTRSSTAGNLSTEEKWKRYSKYSDHHDRRPSLPMNNDEANNNNSAN